MYHKHLTRPAISEAKQASQLKLACNALHTVLCALFGSGKPADRVMSAFFRNNPRCGSRDRRIISEIVYAVLRNWGFLRLRLKDLTLLETGDRAPAAAELNQLVAEAVYLAAIPFPAAHLAKISIPPQAATVFARAERLLNRKIDSNVMVPAWIKEHVEQSFPMAQYVQSLCDRPPMWLRLQTQDRETLFREFADAGLTPEVHPFARNAVAIRNAQINLFTLPAYCEGRFEVQDLASQCIGAACAPAPGERWLDACAGAGGKSLQLADLMQRKGTLVATDVREYKLEDLRKRARRAGFPNIQTRAWDGKALRPQHRERFDGVLVDAPCSCSGVWRRNPDGVWTIKEEEIAETSQLQARILEAAAPGVKPGGILVYATCSIFKEENREQVQQFLAKHPEFVLERFPHPLSGEPVADGMLQVTPADADCDAMFVARMRKLKG
ncbi:MAG: methyltransferase domain-containing protein [Lentisphaeria bacterium]|nr:methyltransferase domain-containing protein [Lentisphaeria bacterium]